MTEGIEHYGGPLGLYRLPLDEQLVHLGYLSWLAEEQQIADGHIDSIETWTDHLPDLPMPAPTRAPEEVG